MATARGLPGREPSAAKRSGGTPAGKQPASRPNGRATGGPAALRALQGRAGNAAVTALVQRLTQTPGVSPAPPPAPVSIEPMADPRFAGVTGKVGRTAAKQRRHAPARSKAAEAQDAAEPPSNDTFSQAAAAQTEVMNARQPGTFDKKAFVAAVRRAIEARAPRNLKEAAGYAESGKAGQVKAEVGGLVGQGKDTASKGIKTATETPPDPSRARPKPVVPMQGEKPGAAPPNPGAAGAVPQRQPPQQTDFRHGPYQIAGKLADAEVTDRQLAESNEPEFSQALQSRQQLQEHAATAPQQARAEEAATLDQARGEARTDTGTTLPAMYGTRTSRLGQVDTRKTGTKAKDEAQRAEVAAEIQSLYEATKTEVTSILNGLDPKVNTAFEEGERAARSGFEARVAREMKEFRERRYSGVRGKLRWGWDELTSPPAEVNRIFDRARTGYVAQMDQVIDRVADIVGTELNRAKERIGRGRDEIQKYVSSLPKNLRKVGHEAAEQVSSQFDALEQDVSAKRNGLVQNLAERYVAAQTAINNRVTQLQEENKGLLQKAADKVGAVVETIGELKDMLLNVLARVADAVGTIIKAPIRFLGNLVSGVKGGFSAFIDEITAKPLGPIIRWLTGAMAGAGLTIPEKFDLKGILSLVLQILGLTWQNVRARIARRIGEPLMRRAEQTVDIVKLLAAEGVAGAWHLLQEKLADLKDRFIEEIKGIVLTEVIKAGVKWILGLLTPAGAFIKACKAIYDIIMFFVSRGSQIMALVNAVIDAVGAIARGSVGQVVSLIKDVLVRAVPLLIGFLASLLGLGNITDKVKGVLGRIQKPVMSAIDWLVNKAVTAAKKLGRTLRGGARKKSSPLGDRADGAAVKAAVRGDLAGTQFQNQKDAEATLASLMSKYKKKGLKGLRLEPPKKPGGQALVLASASLPERIMVSTDPAEIFQIALNMRYWDATTSAYISYGPGIKFGGRITQAGGHAEITILKRAPKLLNKIEKAVKKGQLIAPVPVLIEMNRLPCDGCIEHRILPAFAAASNSKLIRLNVSGASVYKQGQFSFSSPEKIGKLIAAGIQVTPLHIWEAIKTRVKQLGIREIYFRGHVWNIEKWMALKADDAAKEVCDVQALVAEANAGANLKRTEKGVIVNS